MSTIINLTEWKIDNVFLSRVAGLGAPPKIDGLTLILTLTLTGHVPSGWLKKLHWTVKNIQTGHAAKSSSLTVVDRSAGSITVKIAPLFPSPGTTSGELIQVSVTAPSGKKHRFDRATDRRKQPKKIWRRSGPTPSHLKIVSSR
jgi:hypothetical protein